MSLEGPKPCHYWNASANSWRPAVPGEPGDFVWNDTTKSWQPGAIGGNWKWNDSAKSWEPGPGGTHKWNGSVWVPVTGPGYGGSHYWTGTSWELNANFSWSNLASGNALHAWDFLTNQARWNGVGVGALSNTPNWTFTRASTGYAQNAAGTLIEFASGEMRRTDKGVLLEGGRQNLALWSNDWTNAVWTKSNVTATKNQIGPDGVANSATLLTATANNGTVTQAITSTSTARAWFVMLKRITGTGNIDVTLDGGSTWTNIAVTSDWLQLGASQTLANPTVGLRIASSGDEVAVFNGTIISSNVQVVGSPIFSTTAQTTVATDEITVSSVSGLSYPLSIFVEYERAYQLQNSGALLGTVDAGSSAERGFLRLTLGGGVDAEQITGNTTVGSVVAAANPSVGVVSRAAARFAFNDVHMASNGTLGVGPDTSATLPTNPTRILIGTGTSRPYSYIRRFAVFNRALTDAELQAITAT